MGQAGFLIPAYTGLGDFVMMTPMIAALRRTYPSCRIHIIAGNDFGPEFILEGAGIIDKIWILRDTSSLTEKFLFFWRMRGEKIDTAFVPYNASPSFYRLGTMIAGIPRRIGHTVDILNLPMGWTRNALTDAVALRFNCHESDLHFDLLEVLSPGVERRYAPLVHTAAGDEVMKKFGLADRRYIVVQISAANAGPTPKVWPVLNFRLLAERLYRSGFEIVLPGDKNEKPMADEFAAGCPVPVINIAGKTTVKEIAAIIKSASAAVCHDSGLMHIADALKTPLTALYGPTDYAHTRPVSETSVVIRKELPCAPCMANFAKTEIQAYHSCPAGFECMKRITIDEVFEAVMKQASNVNQFIR